MASTKCSICPEHKEISEKYKQLTGRYKLLWGIFVGAGVLVVFVLSLLLYLVQDSRIVSAKVEEESHNQKEELKSEISELKIEMMNEFKRLEILIIKNKEFENGFYNR